MPTYNSKGLLVPDDETGSGALPGGGPVAAPTQSPLAGSTPVLPGGASNVQRIDYGGGIASATKQYEFNPKYALLDQDLQRQIANAAHDRTTAYNTLGAENARLKAEAERMHGLATQRLKNRLLSQGHEFSGARLDQQGLLEGDFTRYNDLIRDQYEGGLITAENNYGRFLGGIGAQREQNWFMQGEEAKQKALEDADRAATAKARAEQAARDQALQQQYIAAMTAIQGQVIPNNRPLPTANTVGGGGPLDMSAWGFGPGDTWQDQLNQINMLPMDMLTSLYAWQEGKGVDDLRTAVRKRIVDMSTPGSPNYYNTPVGHRDNPYGLTGGSGGVAL